MADVVIGPNDYFSSGSVHAALIAERIRDQGYRFSVSSPQKLVRDMDKLPEFLYSNSSTKWHADYLQNTDDLADLFDEIDPISPEDANITLQKEFTIAFFEYDADTLVTARWTEGEDGYFQVYSKLSAAHAFSVVDKLSTLHLIDEPAPTETAEQHVAYMMFTFSTGSGVAMRSRKIEVNPWSETSKNYAKEAHPDLEALIQTGELKADDGKLLLLWGPPGTGKTSFLRSLAWAWRKWATFSVVIDPEVFLSDPTYMLTLLMEQTSKYRWLVLEDCGELIASGAKNRSGQGMSRLLNMADGLLGQGQRLGFLITTNEDVEKLDPAVTRPGRCLAQVKIGSFPPDEASAWLGKRVNRSMTLADLYADGSNSLAAESEKTPENTGLYI